MGKWGVLGATVTLARAAWTVRTWRQVRELPREAVDDGSVTVVVPARDEEASIDRCLTGLRAQDYADLRIVVVDDASTDRTAEIVGRHAAEDPRVELIVGSGPPSGWAGKVHALHVGTADARSDWLLYVDADTEATPDLVGRLIAAARAEGVDLVSAAGRSTTSNAGWWLLLPPVNTVLFEGGSVDGSRGKALAIGHCLLVRREACERAGGWRAIAGSRSDDIDFATLVRDTGGRTRLVDTGASLHTSGLATFGLTYRSMRKSLTAGMSEQGPTTAFLLLSAIGVAHIAYGVAPIVSTLRGSRPGALAWLGQSLAHWAYFRRVGQPRAAAVLAPVASIAFGVLALDTAWRSLRGGATWKGREVRG